MWRDFPDQLAGLTGRPVIAWSREGHGLSDPLTKRRDALYLHQEADRLPALLDALHIERAHLLGHGS
jgi:pimeloyl-ACP methyl ester carboxylesterase